VAQCCRSAEPRLPAFSHSGTRAWRLAATAAIVSTGDVRRVDGEFSRRHAMGTGTENAATGSPQDQREALAESEKRANENQFREENNEEKVVEIPPNKTDRPIRGLDPK
jgi:hypothetical protein